MYDTDGLGNLVPKPKSKRKIYLKRPGVEPKVPKPKKEKVNPDSTKRGKLSNLEHKRIGELMNQNIDPAEIAKILNRPLHQIDAHCQKFYGKSSLVQLPEKAAKAAAMVRELRKGSHWKFLKEQYRPDELAYFEELYASIMADFQDDITTVDSLQILQAIDSVLLINKHKKHRRAVEEKILAIDHQIESELLLIDPNDDKDSERRKALIRSLEEQKAGLISMSNARTKEFTELSQKFDKTVASLKSTRDQRLKTSENSKQSWTALIRHLQDKKVREKEGRHMELVKIAADQAKKDLIQPHRYINGQIDQPLLTPENVLISNSLEDDEYDANEIPVHQDKLERITNLDYEKLAEDIKDSVQPILQTGHEKGVGSGNYTRIKGYHT